jgi:GcrA cell cycle regulator
MVNNVLGWTEERVKILKRMWMAGYSSGDIATHFGDVTRNAVMGKVDRLGLDRPNEMNRRSLGKGGKAAGAVRSRALKAQFGKSKPSWTPKDITPATPPPPKPPIPVVHVSPITGAIIPGPSPLPPRPLAEPVYASGPLIDITAITSRNCCWPVVRDPIADEWLFCGDERDPNSGRGRDRGYCATHRRKSIGRAA